MPNTVLNFEYKDKEYSLYYTVDSLKRLEKSGFSFADLDSRLLTGTEDLFCAAFNAKHSDTPRRVREEIYREMSGSAEGGEMLGDILVEMLNETIEAMKPRGNIGWKVSRG